MSLTYWKPLVAISRYPHVYVTYTLYCSPVLR